MSAAKKLAGAAEKQTRTTVDTILITPEIVGKWKSPPFQRPLKVNDKVKALAEKIAQDGGVLPGIITLGLLGREEYLLDGQHRREAFIMSGCEEGATDVRKHYFDDMASMGEEFVNLNSQLVRLSSDDIMRGLEGTIPGIAFVRRKCPFVGYGYLWAGDTSPVVSMSVVINIWIGGLAGTPIKAHGSAISKAQQLTTEEAESCVNFLTCCEKAWGRDREYRRLWGALNLSVCAWLYRHMHLIQYSTRTPKLSREQFISCLMSLSADSTYLQWLVGRNLCERDRSPAYGRIRTDFVRRLTEELGRSVSMPKPEWAAGGYPGGY